MLFWKLDSFFFSIQAKFYFKTVGFSWVWGCTPVLSATQEAEVSKSWVQEFVGCPGNIVRLKILKNGATEFAHSVKYLPCKHKDLS